MGIRNRFRGTTPVGNWLTGGGNAVKSVQRGTITLNNVVSNTATIASVNTANSVIRFLGVQNVSASAQIRLLGLRVELTTATTVTAFVNTAEASAHVLSFEVIEYQPGVIKSVTRGTIAIVASTTGTATIGAVNMAKAALDLLGMTSTETTFIGVSATVDVVLTNATTVTASMGGAVTATVGYQVVEFN